MTIERARDHFDPYDPEVRDNYYEVMHFMTEQCPATKTETYDGAWVFSRFDDVSSIFLDFGAFSNLKGALLPQQASGWLPGESDPPEHQAYRRVLNPFFKPAVVEGLADSIRETLHGLIDEWIEDGQCDLMADFARVFPGTIFFREFFGITDPAELERCMEFSSGVAYNLGTPVGHEALENLGKWAADFIAIRREAEPRGDVIDGLLGADIEGRPITDDEVVRNVKLLILGGINSTANMTGNGLHFMARDLELQEEVRRRGADLGGVVEEFLRYEPHNTALSRWVTKDTCVSGTELHRGEVVVVLPAAANRDPRRFENPDMLDIDRPRGTHMTFGMGRHLCLGMHLAKLELRLSFEAILSRISSFQLDETAAVTYRQGSARGLEHLRIVFPPGQRRTSIHSAA